MTVEGRVGGLPLALSCDPERCGQRLLQGLQLVARTGLSTSLDLAPYLPRHVILQRFSPTGFLWLGNVPPGDDHLRLLLEGQVIEKAVHLPGAVELF